MIALLAAVMLPSSPSLELTLLTRAPRAGGRVEIEVQGVPEAGAPYDPDQVEVQATFTGPQGALSLPAFWYVPQKRRLEAQKELLEPDGPGSWRVRWTPLTAGSHEVKVIARMRNLRVESKPMRVNVQRGTVQGFIKVNPENPRYLADFMGSPYLPVGVNMCWGGDRGTYDFDDWLPELGKAKINFIRLWIGAPWFMPIESKPGTLNQYDQGALWRLDRILAQCEQLGIQAMLCFDYHGMLETTKDFWGANDNWTLNPYNAANGGPAATQGEFFTKQQSRDIYKKRLRYLIGRYAASPVVMSWEFWNEIDNVWKHFDRNDALAWHREMGQYLRTHDAYRHLITTSLASSRWDDVWRIPEMDLVQVHAYEWSRPASQFVQRGEKDFALFGKPFLVGEYGVDWRGPNTAIDRFGRGLHQAIWGSVIGGNCGSAQSWWWETLHANGKWPQYGILTKILAGSAAGTKGWGPLPVETQHSGKTLRPPDPNGGFVDVKIAMDRTWGAENPGELIVNGREAEAESQALNAHLHGSSKPDIRRPFKIRAHFGAASKLVIHINSVSNEAVLDVLADGKPLLERGLPNKDGTWELNNEYNEDVVVSIPEGTRLIELRNPGADWIFIDWIELKQVRSSVRVESGPALRVFASGNEKEALVWAIDPRYEWPAGAQSETVETCLGGSLRLPAWPDGPWRVTFVDPWTGKSMASPKRVQAKKGLRINLPDFKLDVALRIQR